MHLLLTNPTPYLVGLVVSLASSLLLTYWVRGQARRLGLFDPIDERKLHTEPVPRMGGVAIFWAVVLSLGALVVLFGTQVLSYGEVSGRKLAVVLGGAAAVHLLGLYDDMKHLRARWKLAGQVVIALVVYAAGVRVTSLSLPLVGVLELGSVLGLLFTVVWLVGITNAFNLIDGMDGLASGAALFALTTLFVVATMHGHAAAAAVTVVIAGATLGFLCFNFHPATIFLGDSGSLFLGFMLAGVGTLSSQKSSTAVAVAIPLIALGLPVLDTSLAIARRFLRGQHIFAPDRGHIHHRLLSRGLTPRQVALALYALCALYGLGGLLLVTETRFVGVVLTVVGLSTLFAVQYLRYHEFEELGRLIRRGVGHRASIGRGVRVREAAVRLAQATNVAGVFDMLRTTFEADEFERAEVRLRRSFLEGGHDLAARDRRAADDVAVWSWSRAADWSVDWVELRLPLVSPRREQIGMLVLWREVSATHSALSHIHTIAGELRVEVQRKLLALWPSADGAYIEGYVDGYAAGYADASTDAPHEISLGAADVGRVSGRPHAPFRDGATIPFGVPGEHHGGFAAALPTARASGPIAEA